MSTAIRIRTNKDVIMQKPNIAKMTREKRLDTRQVRVKREVKDLIRKHMANQKHQIGKNKYAYFAMRDLNYFYKVFYNDHVFMSTAYNRAVYLKDYILNEIYFDASMIAFREEYSEDLPSINKLLNACKKTIILYTKYYYMIVETLDKTLRKLPSEVIVDNIMDYVVVRPKEFRYVF